MFTVKVFGVAVKTPPNPPSRDRDQVACVVGHVSRYCISQTCLRELGDLKGQRGAAGVPETGGGATPGGCQGEILQEIRT
jgi:hypothetical protein